MATPHPLDISVVIPIYNEEENVGELVERVSEVMEATGYVFEVILVDDGSCDGTLDLLREACGRVAGLRVVALRRNFGQTSALQAGFDHARGRIIVTLDGDLQNDPADVPRLIALIERGADVVSGWRRDRQDTLFLRKIPSLIANGLIRLLTGVPVHDQGCSLKAYRREVIERLDLYSDMHRFITVLTMWNAAKISEVEVTHHPRRAGSSKYGLTRVGYAWQPCPSVASSWRRSL
jgi:glycosyltransferase involved in cell wall biosynthesis